MRECDDEGWAVNKENTSVSHERERGVSRTREIQQASDLEARARSACSDERGRAMSCPFLAETQYLICNSESV